MRRTGFEPEHVDYRESVRRFIADEVAPNHERWEREGIVDRQLFAAAAEKGMLAIQVPEQYGGAGVDDFRFNQILDEEVGITGIGGVGLGITLHNDICLPYFLHFGNDEQKRRWLPGIADGSLITALAMTEPEIGSDLAGLRTSAVRDGDTYIVNGSKTFS
jgi:alkylation response protein AidB-like acyl-CoA dehydrogenase